MVTKNTIGYGIWQMNAKMEQIREELENNGGEITPELEEMFNEIAQSQEAMVIQSHAFIGFADERITAMDGEIKRLTELKRSLKKAQETIKDWCKNVMECAGIKKIETKLVTASIAACPESVVCDEELICSQYEEAVKALNLPPWVKVSLSVNKTELKNAIKAGKPVHGELVKKNTIRFK